ncbi:NADH:ubiquinone reductase (Na(+)-transporting) subunit F [Acidocella sp.]|uniref:NADH:ubiquinone reductase (Na(+)-transporting) subunit F n=1 Tax=Acidocella sp. TaxID=50710 RepID=UPI003CFD3DF2
MSHQLVIEPLGETIEVEDGQSMLDACLRQGIYLPYACGHGLCGTCKIDVAEGEVDHGDSSPFALMDFEREAGKALACCARLKSDVTIETDLEEDPDQLHIPVRDFQTTVAAIDSLTHDVKGLRLRLENGPMHFQAGQYVNVNLPGVSGTRAFSIANPPCESGHVELQIRRVPGGQGTSYIHDSLRIGDKLNISGPYGRFFVRRSRGGPLLFLAGGTGISSPRAMILDLLGSGYDAPITLIHGVRTHADLYGEAEFTALSASHPNLRYVPTLSAEPGSGTWSGERGFVHEVAARLYDNMFEGLTAYLCGPPPMIEACVNILMQGRLFEKHIFTENFLTADQAGKKARSPLFKTL